MLADLFFGNKGAGIIAASAKFFKRKPLLNDFFFILRNYQSLNFNNQAFAGDEVGIIKVRPSVRNIRQRRKIAISYFNFLRFASKDVRKLQAGEIPYAIIIALDGQFSLLWFSLLPLSPGDLVSSDVTIT